MRSEATVRNPRRAGSASCAARAARRIDMIALHDRATPRFLAWSPTCRVGRIISLSILVGFNLLLLGCGTAATRLETHANVVAVTGSPRLGRADTFVAFVPGFMNYNRHRGSTRNRNTFENFGAGGSVRNFL